MKSKLCFAVFVFLLVFMHPSFYNAYAAGDVIAYVDYTNGVETAYMTVNNGGMATVVRNGLSGVVADKDDSNRLYIWVNIDDSVKYNIKDDTPLDIEIKYYDEGNGRFVVSYSSHTFEGDMLNSSEIVHLTNTMQWKTVTVHLEDMKLDNGTNGYDFRVGIWGVTMVRSPESVIFGSIKVKTGELTKPLRYLGSVSSENGNIFKNGDTPTVGLTYRNRTRYPVDASFTAYVYDELTGELLETLQSSTSFARQTESTVYFTPAKAVRNSNFRIDTEVSEWYRKSPDEIYTSKNSAWFSITEKASEGERSDDFGLNGGHTVTSVGVSEAMMGDMGAKWQRAATTWSQVESVKNKLEMPDEIIEFLKSCKSNGINVLMGLQEGNPVYEDMESVRHMPRTDDDIAAYARFCAFTAEKQKEYVQYYSILNEYNVWNFNKNMDSPETYVKIVKAASEAIEDVYPQAKIVGFEAAHIDLDFIEKAFAAGIGDYIDVVAVHPYDWSGGFQTDTLADNISELKKIMKKYGADMPVWITESGYFTYEPGAGGVELLDGVWHGVTEEEQAAFLSETRVAVKAMGLADKMFVYTFHEFGAPLYNNQDSFGIVDYWYDTDSPNSAKPSYIALSASNMLVGGNAEVKGNANYQNNYAFRFHNQKLGKNVMFCYTSGYGKPMSYNLGVNSVDIYDMYGNFVKEVKSENGYFTFELSQEPFYVIGDFSNAEAVTPEYLIADIRLCDNNGKAIESISEIKTGDKIKIEAETVNYAKEEDCVFVICYYGDSGVEDISLSSGKIIKGEALLESDASIAPKMENIKRIKIYMWNDLENKKPYCASKCI